MAVEEIVIKYSADVSELKKDLSTELAPALKGAETAMQKSGELAGEAFAKGIGDGLKDVKQEFAKVGAESKQVFATQSIDAAVQSMGAYVQSIDELITRYGTARGAQKAMITALDELKAKGQQNSEAFKQLTKQAATLADQMGDTRNAIKKMSSDTRVFDTMMQGARGAAAAFSVFEGAAAALGEENKDLQKSLLKVQGAMAALQGVQELATLATEEGGIATKAYGFALQVVEKIQTTFAISSQAAWAAATAGVSLLVAGIAYLVTTMGDAEEQTQLLTEAQLENDKTITDLTLKYAQASGQLSDYETSVLSLKIKTQDSLDEIEKKQSETIQQQSKSFATFLIGLFNPAAAYRMELENSANATVKNQGLFNTQMKGLMEAYDLEAKILGEQESQRVSKIEDEKTKKLAEEAKKRNDIRMAEFGAEMKAQIAAMKDADSIVAQQIALQNILNNRPEEDDAQPLITDAQVEATDKNVERLLAIYKALVDGKKSAEEQAKIDSEKYFTDTLQFAEMSTQGMSTIVNNIYAQDFQRLEAARDRDLQNAGENAKQKEAIEKKFAIERAKIERQQAISNKIFGITQVILDTIQAISAANKLGFPANIPAMALAAAQGAIQTAAIVSQPIPEIPKFEEGGFVARALKGGQIRPDGFIEGKSHRHGGVLIEAEGKEFITNKTATSKYFDELKAANSLQLEEHINRKYVSPAVERARAESSLYEYDDEGLRADVRNNVRATQSAAKYIVKGVGKELRESSYLLSRYG